MASVTVTHLEQSSGRSADKFYRVYAIDDGRLLTSYGPRGRASTPGRPERHSRAALAAAYERAAQAKRSRGYHQVVTLTFPAPAAVASRADGRTVAALDAAFERAWSSHESTRVTALTAAVAADSGSRHVVRLPYLEGPRGHGGHRHGRPWGPVLGSVVDANPYQYDPATRTTTAVVDHAVAAWVRSFYPGATTSGPVPATVDEHALTALVPQLMTTTELRHLDAAVSSAVLALS